jgi:putative heme-binding domain-containing protein
LNALHDEDLVVVPLDPAPEVRAQAAQLLAKRLGRSPSLSDKVLALADDPDARVRFQVAFALGEISDRRAAGALGRILAKDAGNHWIQTAVLSSSTSMAGRLFEDLLRDPQLPVPNRNTITGVRSELLQQLVEIVGARKRLVEINHVLGVMATEAARLNNSPELSRLDRLVLRLASGSRRSGSRLTAGLDPTRPEARLVAQLAQRVGMIARDAQGSEPLRIEAVTVLGGIAPDALRASLMDLLAPQQPLGVQIAAIQALAEGHSANLAEFLLPRLRGFEAPVHATAVRSLLSQAEGAKALLKATSPNGSVARITAALIEPADRPPLLKHPNPEIAALAHTLFAQSASGSRTQVVMNYLAALRSKGDRGHGTTVFDRECETCRRVGERGFGLGRDLAGSVSSDRAVLLANILDPNANLLPKYVQYVVIDQNGRIYSGVIAAETGTSSTRRCGAGAEDTILRTQIVEMNSTGLSLMPEGFEKTISVAEMADLVAFLRTANRDGQERVDSSSAPSRPLDVGTLPGLIEPDE